MPRVHLLSFYGARTADDGYAERQQFLHQSAARFGAIDVQHPWNRDRLRDTAFYRQHQSVLDQPRGAGFWLWKPWLIRQLLDDIPEGDFLIYHDVGRPLSRTPGIGYQFRRPITPLVEWAEQHGGLFPGIYVSVYGRNARWTKRDCFVLMDCDSAPFHDAPQVWAGMNIWQNNARARAFIDQWLHYCEDPRILTDQPNTCDKPNAPDFKDHRHDQSVLSNLVMKEGVSVFNSPDSFLFRHRDTDYIARSAAVRQLLAVRATEGRESLEDIAASDQAKPLHNNAIACYQLHLEETRDAPLRLLQIDHNPDNLPDFWQRYLPSATIVRAAPLTDNPGRNRKSDIAPLDPGHRMDLERFCRHQVKIGKFDVIVVSGAFTMRDQQLAAATLFPLLSPGGYLFIEGLEAAALSGADYQAKDLDPSGRNSTLKLLRKINVPTFRYGSREFTLKEDRYLEAYAEIAGVHWSADLRHGVAVIRHKSRENGN